MKISEFVRLKTFDDDIDLKLKVDDKFLTGKNMVNQIETKRKPGDKISYYQVLKAEGNNISYTVILDILEEG